MTKKKRWIVTTSGDRSLSDIKKKLAESGFAIDRVLNEIGCITGNADDIVIERLRSIPGVVDISPDTPVDIGPPDSPVTW
jgi:hypothetical protein